MRGAPWLMTVLCAAGLARAEVNTVDKVTTRQEGAKTIVTIQAGSTPSFTAYRLERPSRLVVDVAGGRFRDAGDGPIDVDTWAVGQIATAEYKDQMTRTARVMIGLKRPATYDVRAKGHDVVVTITPEEAPPADQIVGEKQRAEEARARREQAEAQAKQAEGQAKQAQADVARVEAQRQAIEARVRQAEAQAKQVEAQAMKDAEHKRKSAEREQLELAVKLDKLRAETRAAEAAREKALREALVEEKRRGAAQEGAKKLEAEAQERAENLRKQAEEAKRRAEEARAELERTVVARKAEEARRFQVAADSAALKRAQVDARAAQAADARKTQAEAQAQAQRVQAEAQAQAQKMNADAQAQVQKAQADAQKAQADAQKAQAEAQLQAQRAQAQMQRAQAELARAQAETARAHADAQKQAQKAQAEAQAQVQKAQAEAQRAQAELQRAQAETAKAQADTARVQREHKDAQKKLEALRAEALELVAKRDEEAKRLVETQAQARRLANERAERLEEARVAADKRVRASEAAQKAEERKLKAQAEEAERLARAAEASRKAAERDEARRAADEKANRAAEEAKRELVRLEALRAETRRLREEADKARLEVNRQRIEAERMSALQEAERARLTRERDEARRLAEKRAEEAERAARATAMASQSMTKMEAAEREARRLAEERTRESLRIEAARREAEALAIKRSAELKKIEEARAEAQKLVMQRDGELRTLADKRAKEETRLAEAQAAAERKRFEAAKLESEHILLAQKVAAAKGELEKLEKQAQAAREAQAPSPKPEARSPKPAAAAAPPPPSPTKIRESLPVEKIEPPRGRIVRVTDVRFSDDGERSKVIVDLGGEAQYSVLRATPNTAVLRIAGAELPKMLERTMDVSAYAGPVKSVSTYADPADPGAVRVVVNLEGESEPKVAKNGNALAFEFPRPQARSYPPQKVGAFGNPPLPLQPQMGGAPPPTSLPSASPLGRRKKVYTGRRISLDFKDIDIHNVLRLLSDVGQVNIVTSDDVKGSVTIRMVDVPWDQALDVILKAKGLGMAREGNLIRVAPAAALEKEMEQEIARAKAAVELKPIDTRLIPLSYADAQKMMPKVQDVLSPRGKVTIDERTNMLIVSDVAGNIALAEDLVRNLDTQTPQVLIEARIVEARSTFLRTIGIQWGGNSFNSAATNNATGIAFPSTVGVAGGATDPLTNVQGILGPAAASPNYVVNLPAPVGSGSGGALGLTLGSVNGAVNINLRLSSLENTGEVRIISAPKITTLDNVEAQIEQGVAIPISVVSAAGTNTIFVDAKLNLTVKPHVTNEGSVVMNVAITRNEPDFVNVGARGDPTILKKQARTEMLVRDGDTAVIGGIYTRNTGLSYNKVPWFADIPVLGWLFKNRRENDDRTEMLIFITPRIVNRAMVRR